MKRSAPDDEGLSVQLARRARDEAYAARKLATDSDIADAMVGLHADQAVELWLSAVLVIRDSVPPRDHDLGRLIEALRGVGIEPPEADLLRKLNQYAAPLHGEYFLDTEPIDRQAVASLVGEIGEWAEAELDGAGEQ